MIGPTTTGMSRFFSSSATFQASMPPLRIILSFRSSASLIASSISALRLAWMNTGFCPLRTGTSASSRGLPGVSGDSLRALSWASASLEQLAQAGAASARALLLGDGPAGHAERRVAGR